jgi:hypothetical protein
MRFLRAIKECVREDRTESIRGGLQMCFLKDRFNETRRKWRENMEEDRLPKVIISYKSRGRKLQRRPRKRHSLRSRNRLGLREEEGISCKLLFGRLIS